MATAYPTIEEDENLRKGKGIEKEEYKLPTPLRDYKDNRKNLEILKQLKELVSEVRDTDMEYHAKQVQRIYEGKEIKENRNTGKVIKRTMRRMICYLIMRLNKEKQNCQHFLVNTK